MEKAMAFKNFELQAKASLAVAKAALLKWDEAGKYAADVSALVQHRDPTMLNIMGIAASNLGNNAKAEEALLKAVTLQPDNAVYKRDLGVVYVRLHKFPEARNMLEGAAFSAGVPEDLKNQSIGLVASMTAYELGQVNELLRTNKRNEAVDIMKRVMQSKLTASSTRESIAQTLIKLGAITPEKVNPGETSPNNH
jgi:tetratricopeptide (TPR) repeat protein